VSLAQTALVQMTPRALSDSPPTSHAIRCGVRQTFRLHQCANPTDNQSPVIRDNRCVSGSAKIVAHTFADVHIANATDIGSESANTGLFSVNGVRSRKAPSRDTPNAINAVFNVWNSRDGRAREVSTDATPFGDSDQTANVPIKSNGHLMPTHVRFNQSSLASQRT